MKRFLILLSFLATMASGFAFGCESQDYSFYIKVASGVCAAECVNVCAPYPPWAPALQGYRSGLGTCAIVGFSVGCELFDVLDLEVNVANRSRFEYRKLQTPTAGGASYTREFDLDVTSIFFAANLLGKGIPHFHWDLGSSGVLYPMLGGGLGASNLLITNYRTTGLPATGDSSPYASFSAENEYTLRKNFTYTVLAGFEYSCNDYWAVSTGYRWFDAGCFRGPRYQRVASGAAVDVADDAWKMRFRANEWFLEFKIFV